MANKPSTLSTLTPRPPVPLAEEEYEAIHAAVMASARGRWFLDEYARRSRRADTVAILAAIERIEAVIGGEHAQQQSRRIALLDMAHTIARARAEVAESGSNRLADEARSDGATPSPNEVVAAAQRLQDIVWAMREQGIDPVHADQIGELATTILSASALHDPADRRGQKLGEVLRLLERRIEEMLEASAGAAKDATIEVRGATAPEGVETPAEEAASADVALPVDASPPAEFLLHPLSKQTSLPATVASVPRDPLAAIKAMSEEERIALFT